MKNLLLIIGLFLMMACKNDKPVTKNTAPAATDSHAGHDHETEDPKHIKGDISAFLVGLWEYEYALVGATPKADERFKGRWIDMKADNTFTSGFYDEQNNSGTYGFVDEPERTLTIKYDKPENIPTVFRVQGYSMGIVLIGVMPESNRQVQVKLGQTSSKPQKPK